MNILHIISSSNFGGAENYVYMLSKCQGENNNRIFFYRTGVKKLNSLIKDNNIATIDITKKIYNSISFIHIYNLFKLIKKYKIDIIHTHLSKASILGGLAGKLTNTTSIATVHGMNKYSDYKFNDRLIAVSKAVKNKLIQSGAPSKKVKVIFNGIEKKDDKIKCSFSKNSLKMLFVGRLSKEKGLVDFIKNIKSWNNDKWKLKIAGEGVLKNKLIKIIKKYNLGENIEMLGFKNDVKPYYLWADILVLPSFKEGLPISILESFSYGLPVLGRNIESIREVLTDDKTGFLFNKETLFEKLNYIHKNKEILDSLSSNCLNIFNKNYTIEKNCSKVISFYEENIKR